MARYLKSFLVAGVLVMVAAMVGGAKAMFICNMDPTQLSQCLPAMKPPVEPPTAGCCDVMHGADLQCLCSYKSLLPSLGLDPVVAMQLPAKCNMTQAPVCASEFTADP